MKGIRGACCHAGRLPASRQTIHAEIAFLHLAIGAKLRHPKGTDQEAGPAAHTFVRIYHDNPVLGPLLDSSRRTRRFARRVPAVHTGEGNTLVRDTWVPAAPDADNPSPPHAEFDVVQALAGYFTGVALDTPLCIKVETVLFCHRQYLLFF
jgi:hypothetical protein